MQARHGDQCICQICTCGRHRCPHDRNKSRIFFGDEQLIPDQYQKKDRPRSNEGKQSNASVNATLNRSHHSEYSLNQETLAAQERFNTSAALRERGRRSQINLNQNDSPAMMSTSYQIQNEFVSRASYNPVRPVPVGKNKNQDIFASIEGNQKSLMTSVNHQEYGQKQVVRSEIRRPRTSDLWKTSGIMDNKSVSKLEYAEKHAESVFVKRPKDSGILNANGATFHRETSNLSDYNPKIVIERASPVRHPDSDVFKRNGTIESTSVNRSDYSAKKGDRYDAKRPGTSNFWEREGVTQSTSVNQSEYLATKGDRYEMKKHKDSDVFKGGEALTTESTSRTDYLAKKGDRYETKRPGSSDLWKREGVIESKSVNQTEYSAIKGDRFETMKHKDSNILKNDGVIVSKSTSRADFDNKIGKREKAKRPLTSDIWKAEGRFDSTSVNKSEYYAKKGERCEIQRPQDSNLLKGEGKFAAETTSSRQDFHSKGCGDSYPVKVHGASEIWKRDGKIESTSVMKNDFSPKKGKDSYAIKKPYDSEFFESSKSDTFLTTSHRDQFGLKKGYRNDVKKNSDQLTDSMRLANKFADKTSTSTDFKKKEVNRVEAKNNVLSDIWKINKDQKMDSKTTSQTDFCVKTPEPARQKRTTDGFQSQIISPAALNEKLAALKTSSFNQYTLKQGESYDVKRSTESDIWKHEGKMNNITVTQEEFVKKDGDLRHKIIPPNQWTVHDGFVNQNGTFNSVTHNDFGAIDVSYQNECYHNKLLDRSQVHNCSNISFVFNNDNQNQYHSITHDEFGLKSVSNRSSPVHYTSELKIVDPNATFENCSVYGDDFRTSPIGSNGKSNATPKLVRPSTALKLTGEHMMTTGYQEDFDKKQPNNAAFNCIAGELVTSIKHNHAGTEHFKFQQVNNGHHYYQPKKA